MTVCFCPSSSKYHSKSTSSSSSDWLLLILNYTLIPRTRSRLFSNFLLDLCSAGIVRLHELHHKCVYNLHRSRDHEGLTNWSHSNREQLLDMTKYPLCNPHNPHGSWPELKFGSCWNTPVLAFADERKLWIMTRTTMASLQGSKKQKAESKSDQKILLNQHLRNCKGLSVEDLNHAPSAHRLPPSPLDHPSRKCSSSGEIGE